MLVATLCLGIVGAAACPVWATPVSEMNELPESVRGAAITEAVLTTGSRYSYLQELQNCVLAKLNMIKENVVAKLPKAQPDDVTEEVIAREIRGQCLNQKQAFSAPPDSYLRISDFFKKFADNLAKVEVLRISIGTQAALDLLNKEDARGDCIIEKFLVGTKAAGMVELVADLKGNMSGSGNIESSILKIIDKQCGLDAYASFLKTHDAANKVLTEREKELDKKIAEEETKLAEMRRHTSRLPDGRFIFSNRAGDRWYSEDHNEVPSELARKRVLPPDGGWENDKENPFENNAKNIGLIFDAFKDNEMIVRDESTRSVTLGMSLGPHGYWVKRAVDPDIKVGSDCYFEEFRLIDGNGKKDAVVSYVDIGCDGTLDSTNQQTIVWPTNSDHKKYQKLLGFLAKFVPVTRLYKTHLSPPDIVQMLSDLELRSQNKILLSKIMDELNASDIRDISGNDYQVHFVGKMIEIAFAVEQVKDRSSTNCVVAEKTKNSYVVLHDDGCSGVVSYSESSGQKYTIRDSDLNPMLYDMLTGLERFANLGRETFPKR